MGRPLYASDHRPWFRVRENILDNEKLARLAPADRWLYMAILATANRQRSRDGVVVLPQRLATSLADRKRWDKASISYSRLGHEGLIAWRYENDTVVIHVPKWLEIQEVTPTWLRHGSDVTPTTSPSPSPSPKTTPKDQHIETAELLPATSADTSVEGSNGKTEIKSVGTATPDDWTQVEQTLLASTYLQSPKLRDWDWWAKIDAIYINDTELDFNAELRKMDEWLSRDRRNRLKKDWRRFVSNWLSRASEV